MNNWKHDSRKLIFKIGDSFIQNAKGNTLLLKAIFKCGYTLNYNSPYDLLTNRFVLHLALKNASNISIISDIINFYSKIRIDTPDIEAAIEKGYDITEESPIYIRSSSYFLALYLRRSLQSSSLTRYAKLALVRKVALGEAQSRLKKLIKNDYDLMSLDQFVRGDLLVYMYSLIYCEQLDEEEKYDRVTKVIDSRNNAYISYNEVMFAIKLGYKFSDKTPHRIKNDSRAIHLALLNALKFNDLQKTERITRIIDYADYYSMKDIKLAINNGYKYSKKSPYYFRTSSDIIHYALESIRSLSSSSKLSKINEIMSNINGEITVKDLHDILSFGYEIPLHPRYHLLDGTQQIINKLLKQTNNPNVIDLLMERVSNENIFLAFKLGYQLSDNSSYAVRNNPLAIHLELLKIVDQVGEEKNTEIRRIINLAIGSIYQSDIDYALENDYTVSNNTPKIILNNNDKMYNYFYSKIDTNGLVNQSDELKDKFASLARKIGYGQIILLYDKFFKYPQFIKMFSVDDLYNILRYVYMNSDEARASLEVILKMGYIGNVNVLYNLFNSNVGLNNMKLFKTLCINYLKYQKLCDDFINNKDIVTYSDELLLYKLLIDHSIITDDSISSLLELRNWKSIIYDKYNCAIKTSDEIAIKDIIFQMLCNKTYQEVNEFIDNVFNTVRIDRLLLSIKNPEIRDSLLMYRAFMEYLESINQINNIEHLRVIAFALTKLHLNASESLNIIMRHFKDIDTKVKLFYGEEIKERVTDFRKLENLPSDDIVVTKQKYCASDMKIDDEDLHGRMVDYIELNGYPFLAFAHVLNAFGCGGKITDFKKERLIGKSYICLSAFSDKYLKLVRGLSLDENHVTLLFSQFSNNQLVTFSYKDLLSAGKNNDLDIELHSHPRFAPINDIIDATRCHHAGYNEYIMYRDGLYPNAVLVRGLKPRKSEINAAAYLGIPLVKIHKSKYKKKVVESSPKLPDAIDDKKELCELKMVLERLQELIGEQNDHIDKVKKVT